MVRRADLDEALQEEPRFAVLLTPDALEDFVRLEEVAVVEEADAFLDRIQADRRVPDHPQGIGRRGESSFAGAADSDRALPNECLTCRTTICLTPHRPADREDPACASIVWMTAGV